MTLLGLFFVVHTRKTDKKRYRSRFYTGGVATGNGVRAVTTAPPR
jgi:hypothetical protein